MSTQFTFTNLRGILAQILLAGSLAVPAFNASAEADAASGPGLGAAIAYQGNAALRAIRKDIQRSLHDSRPILIAPPEEARVAPLSPAGEPASVPLPPDLALYCLLLSDSGSSAGE